jgi:NAD/NADP transhydrogenase beta subunit
VYLYPFLQAVAFGKLQGILDSKPLNLPGKNLINLGLLGGVLTCGGLFLTTGDTEFATNMLWATAALGGVLGAHLTASIGTHLWCSMRVYAAGFREQRSSVRAIISR